MLALQWYIGWGSFVELPTAKGFTRRITYSKGRYPIFYIKVILIEARWNIWPTLTTVFLL